MTWNEAPVQSEKWIIKLVIWRKTKVFEKPCCFLLVDKIYYPATGFTNAKILRDIYKTNTNTSVKGLVVFSWPRRYIILHRANTGSVWAPLINLSSPQERFTNTNTNIKKYTRQKYRTQPLAVCLSWICPHTERQQNMPKDRRLPSDKRDVEASPIINIGQATTGCL